MASKSIFGPALGSTLPGRGCSGSTAQSLPRLPGRRFPTRVSGRLPGCAETRKERTRVLANGRPKHAIGAVLSPRSLRVCPRNPVPRAILLIAVTGFVAVTMANTIKDNLELQMSEIEMLFSMFPNKGEIALQDENALHNVQQYLNSTCEDLPHKTEYSVAVAVGESKERVSLQVMLPYDYPHAAPQLFARSRALDREQQLQLNKDLASHVASLESGELCIWTVMQWLQDNGSSYLKNSKLSSAGVSKEKVVTTFFSRMWIYSHHIYRQELRKKIFDCAKKLNLTGFCLTGKPGIICVEGVKENCEEFWHVIRCPNWKHISCKHVESAETEGNEDHLRRFHSFEDLQFQAHGDYGLRNDYHMDLGQFLEFLKDHQSEHVFQILFGVEGKSSDN